MEPLEGCCPVSEQTEGEAAVVEPVFEELIVLQLLIVLSREKGDFQGAGHAKLEQSFGEVVEFGDGGNEGHVAVVGQDALGSHL